MYVGDVGSEKTQKNYITGIDGLRAIAVLMVLAYHLRLPFAKGGLLGVTIFFVISGYLLTRSLLPEVENTGKIDFKTFAAKRVKRLIPAIFVMATIIIIVSAIFNRVLFTKGSEDYLSAILGYNNWWQIFNNVSYFENAGTPSPFTHTWSQAIEAQFFILFPIFLLLMNKFFDKKILIRVTIVLAIISMALMWLLFDPTKDPSRVYYGTDTRLFSLLFGALLAMVNPRLSSQKKDQYLRQGIGAAALIGLLVMTATIYGFSDFWYKGGLAIASILGVLVIYGVLDGKGVLSKVLSILPFRYISERSYGIYLWHYPLILLISGGRPMSWWQIAITLILTLVAVELSYRYVETPIRRDAIKKNIAIIRKNPRSSKGRERQMKVFKKVLIVTGSSLAVVLVMLLCMLFVPRKQALNTEKEMQAKAQKAQELAAEKLKEAQANKEDKAAEEEKVVKTDEEILAEIKLLLIGDSIALGATDQFYATFPQSISDAAVSRFATEVGGIYNHYAVDSGWNGDGVIFALGTNGTLGDSLPVLRQELGPDKPLFVITGRAPFVSWIDDNNQQIKDFVKATPNTYLVDWYALSEGHPEYFEPDETHPNVTGADAYIQGIKDAVLVVYREKKE